MTDMSGSEGATGADTVPRPPATALLAYLDLLAREAPAEDFEEVLVAARARGEHPGTLAELEQGRGLALRVRRLLEQRRRRAAELTGLVETAADLAALRGVDQVLAAIVHRARRLLATDIAYLTLHDEQGSDTYMRVTDGAVSAWFRHLRLPMGAGLGGLVAQTGAPYVTENYLDDARFRHTSDIDGAVHEEGLVAILGVPLALGPRVIGVLFAANRAQRPFTRDDVDLLGSLAALAAVALDGARLLERTRAAADELAAAHARTRAHHEAIERAVAMHDRVTDVVLRGGGVDDVAGAVTDVLGGGLAVLDADGRTLAVAGPLDGGLGDHPDLAEALETSRATGRAVHLPGMSVVAVLAGSEPLGALVHLHPEPLSDGDRRILERAALVAALLLLFRRGVAEAESRIRGELLDDLLSAADPDPAALAARARRLGVDLRRPHVVVVARTSGADPRRLEFSAQHAAAPRGGLVSVRGGDVVVLVPCGHAAAPPGQDGGGHAPRGRRGAAAGCPGHARELGRELTGALGGPVTVGSAGPAAGVEELRAAHVEALRCVEALIALSRTGEAAASHELGYVGLLLAHRRDVPAFVDAALGPVLDYDRRRGTALVATLTAYFACSGSATRTADRLHVHVNTVAQRLERIGQLLGPDWQEPDRALDVQLALRLHGLTGPLGP